MILVAAKSTRIDRDAFDSPRGGLQRIDELVPAVLARYHLAEADRAAKQRAGESTACGFAISALRARMAAPRE